MPWHHWPVTGSTLYRRLPDGTWAAEREDPGSPAVSASAGAAASVPVIAAAAAAGSPAGPPGAPAAAPPTPPAAAQPTLARPVPPARPRRPRGRTIRRVLVLAVAAYLAWLVGLGIYVAASLTKVEALSPDPIADTAGTVWLLVGSDSRAGLTAKEQAQLHTGDEEGQRTDTIMLVHMQAGQAPTLVSVPRDSWVTIPAHTATDGSEVGPRGGKINAAFAYGGAPLLSQTIEYNTGLHVDHYMEVGMGGVVSMTNAIGGVEVCFDEPITDENSGLDVEAGCQVLNGRDALAWVRMRYADPTGDLGRMERQQQWVRLVMDEMLSWQTLVNPVRQWQIANAVLDAITVDQGTGTVDLGRFGLGMARVAGGSGEITTVPTTDSDHWENGQWVLKWDTAEADQLFASMGGSAPQAQQDAG